MRAQLRIGIAGYGNLGRGVEAALNHTPDMSLAAVFSRRPAEQVHTLRPDTPVLAWDELEAHRDAVDVLILCGGSRVDLPVQSPRLAEWFCLVDSFDTHAKIPEHFAAVDAVAGQSHKTALISAGWDPGLFSVARVLGEAIIPQGDTHTFWGRGLSQGHSDAVRRVPGVAAAAQYTVPSESAMATVRAGERPNLTVADMHTRECFVVLEPGADEAAVAEAIVTMPHYFEPYDTVVNFISAEEFAQDHSAMPHGGFVIRSGVSHENTPQSLEFGLTLGSNPEFTASVLVAYARAVHRLNARGHFGAVTVLDVPPGLLHPADASTLRSAIL